MAYNWHSTLVLFKIDSVENWKSHKTKLSDEADLTLDKIHVAFFLFLGFNTCI